MRVTSLLYFFTALCLSLHCNGQSGTVRGTISDSTGNIVPGVYIFLNDSTYLSLSDSLGNFSCQVPCCTNQQLVFKYTGYKTKRIVVNVEAKSVQQTNIVLVTEQSLSVVIQSNRAAITGIMETELNPIIPKYLPSAFGDFSKSITGMALGVSSPNEFSGQYSVRGGNYDENLIYVNDIEIYKPQIINAGQQEGLSFVNPDLVQRASFSSGGWEAKYGDKLSSVLAVGYRTPSKFRGSLTTSILGGSVHLESKISNRFYVLTGARLKSSRYLLNTLDTKGEYLPLFWDWQTIVTIDLTSKNRLSIHPLRSSIELLSFSSFNQYLVKPTNRQTSFGTLDSPLQLDIGFDGREEVLNHSIQNAARWNKTWSNRFQTSLLGSYIYSVEREYFDIEAGYRISEVDPDPSTSSFNQNLVTKGLGTYFDHGRNKLQFDIIQVGIKSTYKISTQKLIESGISYYHEQFKDVLDEYSFKDSSDYVTMTKLLYKENTLVNQRIQPYVQYTHKIDSTHVVVIGVRGHYWSTSNEFLVSPRIQYQYFPKRNKTISYKAAAGIYYQPGFYRELRRMDGTLNTSIQSQHSYHLISGIQKKYKWWDRTFVLTSEIYYKYITNVIPYDLNDIRIRYYGDNLGTAYAYGMDVRLNGEFIKGLESWFNLGILSTRENVSIDDKGYIRRPSDQRVTATIFFQDHIPNNPSIRVFLNMVFGTGLPFGPPNSPNQRSIVNAPFYRRVDIGFSKLITLHDKSVEPGKLFESIWLSAEIINLLGTPNTISYMWLADFNQNQYAIPNTLSQRFINLKLITKF